jgi:hypothetical protein
MGICCSKAAAGELDEDDGYGFPWNHDDLLWNSARVSMHTKQGWKGANQDAMTVSQVTSLPFCPLSLPLQLGLIWPIDRFEKTAQCCFTASSFLYSPECSGKFLHLKILQPKLHLRFLVACMYFVRNPPL